MISCWRPPKSKSLAEASIERGEVFACWKLPVSVIIPAKSKVAISSVINFCFGENNFANPVALEDVSIPVRETPVFCNSCMNLPSPHPKSKRFFGLISLKIFL